MTDRKHFPIVLFYCLLSLTFLPVSGQTSSSVSFEKWLSLKQAGSVVLSPDGNYAAFTVSSTDWKENSYDNEIWIAQKGQKPFQLTRTAKGTRSAGQEDPFTADRL